MGYNSDINESNCCCRKATVSPCSTKAPDCTCLFICDGTNETPAKPCGAAGFTDFSPLITDEDTCVCESELSFHVQDNYDKTMFTNVHIIGTELHYETVGEAGNRFSDITIRAICKDKDGITRAYSFCITLFIEDPCACVECDDKCEECDPCTGECIAKGGKIKISESIGGKIIVK